MNPQLTFALAAAVMVTFALANADDPSKNPPKWKSLITEFCDLPADQFIASAEFMASTQVVGDRKPTRTSCTPPFKEEKQATTIADIVKLYGKPTTTQQDEGKESQLYFWGPLFFIAHDQNSKPAAMGIDWALYERENQ